MYGKIMEHHPEMESRPENAMFDDTRGYESGCVSVAAHVLHAQILALCCRYRRFALIRLVICSVWLLTWQWKIPIYRRFSNQNPSLKLHVCLPEGFSGLYNPWSGRLAHCFLSVSGGTKYHPLSLAGYVGLAIVWLWTGTWLNDQFCHESWGYIYIHNLFYQYSLHTLYIYIKIDNCVAVLRSSEPALPCRTGLQCQLERSTSGSTSTRGSIQAPRHYIRSHVQDDLSILRIFGICVICHEIGLRDSHCGTDS